MDHKTFDLIFRPSNLPAKKSMSRFRFISLNYESGNLPDRDFRTSSEQAANKFPTTSVLFNVGIAEILSCNSLYVE